MNNLRVKFSKNLNEDKGFVLFSKEELEGIPEDTLNQYEKVDGKFKVTFKYPDIFPILNMLGTLTQEKLQILRTETDVQKTILF